MCMVGLGAPKTPTSFGALAASTSLDGRQRPLTSLVLSKAAGLGRRRRRRRRRRQHAGQQCECRVTGKVGAVAFTPVVVFTKPNWRERESAQSE